MPATVAAEGSAEEERVQWPKRALRYIQTSMQGLSLAPASRSIQRVKAYQWLCATDACLWGVRGRGWKYFHQPVDSNIPSSE